MNDGTATPRDFINIWLLAGLTPVRTPVGTALVMTELQQSRRLIRRREVVEGLNQKELTAESSQMRSTI